MNSKKAKRLRREVRDFLRKENMRINGVDLNKIRNDTYLTDGKGTVKMTPQSSRKLYKYLKKADRLINKGAKAL